MKNPRSPYGICASSYQFSSAFSNSSASLARRWHVRTRPTRHFRRHADGLAQRGVRVARLANIHGIRTHLDGQRGLANHVTGVGTDHAAAQDLAVAPASMAVS